MDIGWKAASTAALLIAGLVSDNIVNVAWKAVTGHHPPRGEDEAEARLAELLVFAVVSAILATLLRRLTMKKAAKWYGGSQKRLLANEA